MRITLDKMDGRGEIEFDEVDYEDVKGSTFMELFASICAWNEKFKNEILPDDLKFFQFVSNQFKYNEMAKVNQVPKKVMTEKQKLKLWILVKKYYRVVNKNLK